jgi:DNA-binding response OmpR family regulator
MQSRKLTYDGDDPKYLDLLKEFLESTGKFTVLSEQEEDHSDCFKKERSKKLWLIGNYKFNEEVMTLQWNEEIQHVTCRENEILRLLSENANNLVTRNLILTSFWKEVSGYNSRSLDLFICHLRKKLKKDPSIKILTIRGRGFILRIERK